MRPERHLRSVVAGGGGVGEAPPASRRTITLVGARGGQGTTTIACTLALLSARHRPTTLTATDARAAATILSAPYVVDAELEVGPNLRLATTPGDGTTIVDAGPIHATTPIDGRRIAVLRGPCYLALTTLARHAGAIDGVILVVEPERAIRPADVGDVLDVPVVATVTASTAVARAIDAGLLNHRLARLPDLAGLAPLVAPDPRSSAPQATDTDLLRP